MINYRLQCQRRATLLIVHYMGKLGYKIILTSEWETFLSRVCVKEGHCIHYFSALRKIKRCSRTENCGHNRNNYGTQ